MLRLTDLREILRYVPHFRDKVFVIAVDDQNVVAGWLGDCRSLR